jgi:F-type H+-transporting ATPase subunit epsilon
MAHLRLQIVTPQKEVLAEDADWVVLPGSEGELGILPNHVPLMTTLGSGILTYGQGETKSAVAVHYGYAQVRDDEVVVLAEMAETIKDIDADRAGNALQRAREELQRIMAEQVVEEQRMKKYEAKLRRALVRSQLMGQ